MIKRLIIAVLALLGFSLPALAQALADRVPPDALLYIGWSGTDALSADYSKSTLKKLAAQTNLESNLDKAIPGLADTISTHVPQIAPQAKAVCDLLQILLHRPFAIYFGGASITNGAPNAKFAIICDGGNNPAGLLQSVKDLAVKTGVPFTAELHAGRYISIGAIYPVPDSVEELLDNPAGDSLANLPDFKTAIAKTSPKAALTLFADIVKLTQMTDDLYNAAGTQSDKNSWKKARTAYAFEEIRHVTLASGFAGADWSTRIFIDSPAKMTDNNTRAGVGAQPRRGLPGLFESQPLSPDLLKLIPADSSIAVGINSNFDQAMRKTLVIIDQVENGAAKQFAQALQQLKDETGIQFQDDLIATLGGDWGAFLSPSIAGTMPTGIVLVNKLANPAKFTDSVSKLEKIINPALEKQTQGNKTTISLRAVTVGKTQLHYLATPFASPAFAVRDGVLYAGLYPQPVLAAMDYVADGGKSIADNPQFKTLFQQSGSAKPSAFTFVDLPALANGWFGIAMAADRVAAGFPDLIGVPMPEPMLPTLPQLMKNLTPMGTLCWQDDSGFYLRSASPVPIADLPGLAANNFTSSLLSLGADAAIVRIQQMRTAAKANALWAQCSANFRQIGQACAVYMSENQDKMPPDLGALALSSKLPPSIFLCPANAKPVPPDLKGQDLAKWINENTDYVYLGAEMTSRMNNAAELVVAHEKNENHNTTAYNILFLDGHVNYLPKRSLDQALARSKQLQGK